MPRRTSSTFIGIALFGLALTALACASSGAAPTVTLIPTFGPTATPTDLPATPTELPVPEGWTRVQTDDGLASIALPPGWVVLRPGTDETKAAIDSAAQTNATLGAFLTSQQQQAVEKKIGLVAAQLVPELIAQDYVPNVTVAHRVFDIDVTLDEFAKVNHEDIAKIVGEKALSEKRQVIAGYKGGVFTYVGNAQLTDTVDHDLGIVQYFLTSGPRSIYLITFGCLREQAQDLRPTYDQIIDTLVVEHEEK